MNNSNNIYNENLGPFSSLSEKEVMLQPGQPLELPADQFIAGAEESRLRMGIGFSGILRTVIECNPGQGNGTETFFVFDRGPDAGIGQIADVDPAFHKTTVFVKGRYVVMTGNAVHETHLAAVRKWSVKSGVGWNEFTANTEVEMGRNPETTQMLGIHLKPTVSRKHFSLGFADDGRISITDQGSTNGTTVHY